MNVKLLNFIEKQDNYLDFSIFVSILDGGGRHRRHHGRGGGGIRCIRRIRYLRRNVAARRAIKKAGENPTATLVIPFHKGII